jgi:Fe-coproporphyrin III synthase
MKLGSAESGSALETSLQQSPDLVPALADPHTIRTLPVLVVHAHTSCNCRCIMCDIWKTREGKSFGVRDLQPHIASIKKLGVRWLVFSGGEPLLNPELPLLCALLRKEDIRLTLLTTGLLLQKCAADVAASFDDVIVSLDGPPQIHDAIRRVDGAFALIAAGIKVLRQHRHDLPITARTTIQKANHRHLRETVRAAQQIHLNGISFLAADLTSTAFNRPLAWPVIRQDEIGLSLQQVEALDAEIEALIEATPCGTKDAFVAETPDKLRRIANHFRVQLGLQPAEAPVCNAPWVSAVVEVDGSVRPCFFHPPIGNLQEGTLESVLNKPQARNFRENLVIQDNPICRRCVCSLHYRL